MLKIKTPATTANMGAGFDAFGMAFDLFNEITIQESDNFKIISQDLTIPTDESNLIYKSIKHFYSYANKPTPTIQITQTDRIPQARGLGSSAACVVGGLVAANALAGNIADSNQLLKLACEIEGHPDNVAPALLGGLVTSVAEAEKVHYVKITPPDGVTFVALIPNFKLETKSSRGVLPAQYSKADVTFNIARASLFIATMASGKWENIPTAIEDKIHQPYRKPLVPGMDEVINKAKACGALGTYLSGAGPTVMAIVLNHRHQEFISAFKSDTWQVKTLKQNFSGAYIEE